MTNADDPGSRAEQLIGIADRLANEPVPSPPRRWIPVVLGAVLLLGGGGAIAYALSNSDDSSQSASPVITQDAGIDETAPSVAQTTDVTVSATTAPTDSTSPAASPSTTATTTTTTTSAATTTTAPAAVTTTTSVTGNPSAADGTSPVRWAEFTGGKVYLRGEVPDRATADEIISKAGAAVGAGNVVDEYKIVPGASRPLSAPLFVRDSVLFQSGSTEISASAAAVLDLGIALMTQNPQVTADILGHTDDIGSEESNLALSETRVQAIYNYLVIKGVAPERLTKIALGESKPIADNSTPEGRALNRRVEFTINSLLG